MFLARRLQVSGFKMTSNTARLKQELYSMGHAFAGCIVVSFVLAGIGGTIYKLISPDGWIFHAFGRNLSAGAAALGSAVLVTALVWFSRHWGDRSGRNWIFDLVVYSFAFVGFVYFALFLKGTF